jgi:hypothetical protein
MLSTIRKSNRHSKTLAATVALFCLALMAPQPASADPITGDVAFFGIFTTTGGSGLLDLANATAIDFTFATVAAATGDFNAANGVMPFISPVTLNDFTFSPFSSAVDPLWAVGIFQFALETLTSVQQGTNFLALSGYGTASGTGFDDTMFFWSFSGDNAGGTLQLFSSTSTPLPEPSELLTFALLAMGMAVFGVWSRKHRRAVQQ